MPPPLDRDRSACYSAQTGTTVPTCASRAGVPTTRYVRLWTSYASSTRARPMLPARPPTHEPETIPGTKRSTVLQVGTHEPKPLGLSQLLYYIADTSYNSYESQRCCSWPLCVYVRRASAPIFFVETSWTTILTRPSMACAV